MRRDSHRENSLTRSIDNYRQRVERKKKRVARIYACCPKRITPESASEEIYCYEAERDSMNAVYAKVRILEGQVLAKLEAIASKKKIASQLEQIVTIVHEAQQYQTKLAESCLAVKEEYRKIEQSLSKQRYSELELDLGDNYAWLAEQQRGIAEIDLETANLEREKVLLKEELAKSREKLQLQKQSWATLQRFTSEIQEKEHLNMHHVAILREQLLIVRNSKVREYNYETANPKDRMFDFPALPLGKKVAVDVAYFLASCIIWDARTVLLKHSYFTPETSVLYPPQLLQYCLTTPKELPLEASLSPAAHPFSKVIRIMASEQLIGYAMQAVDVICRVKPWKLQPIVNASVPTLQLSDGASKLTLLFDVCQGMSLRITTSC